MVKTPVMMGDHISPVQWKKHSRMLLIYWHILSQCPSHPTLYRRFRRRKHKKKGRLSRSENPLDLSTVVDF